MKVEESILKKKSFIDKIKSAFSSSDQEIKTVRNTVKTLFEEEVKKNPPSNNHTSSEKLMRWIGALKDSQLIFALKKEEKLTKEIENTLSTGLKTQRDEKERVKDELKKLDELLKNSSLTEESIEQVKVELKKLDGWLENSPLTDEQKTKLKQFKKIVEAELKKKNQLLEKKDELREIKAKKEKELEVIKLSIRIEKAKLGLKLGVAFVKNKGATGTVKVRNLKGDYIGVFKPDHAYTPTKARLLNAIKRTFGANYPI